VPIYLKKRKQFRTPRLRCASVATRNTQSNTVPSAQGASSMLQNMA